MAYAGLQTLYDNLGPGTASLIAGERENIAQQGDMLQQQSLAETIKQQQAANQLNQATLADQIRAKALANQQAEAALSGTNTTNSMNELKLKNAQATNESDIAATQSKNKGIIGKEQFENFERFGQIIGHMGSITSQMPPMFQEQAKREFMEKNGFNPDSSVGKFILSAKPEQLQAVSKQMTELSSKYVIQEAAAKARAEAGENKNQTAIDVANIRAAATLGAAQMRGAGKGGTSEGTLRARFNSLKPEVRISVVKRALETNKNPVTDEQMSPEERLGFESMLKQDVDTFNTNAQVRSQQGILPQVGPQGNVILQNKAAPQLSGGGSQKRKSLSDY